MKTTIGFLGSLAVLLLVWTHSFAQQPMQFFRPYDQRGLNIFETGKADTIPFTGFKVRVGGNFTQQFQSLQHENFVDTTIFVDANGDNADDRLLMPLTNGFNLATANFNIDAELYDGIHINLVTYLSSRHHQEAWVKGGYIQMDKLTFLNSPTIDNLMNYLTLKIGDYEVNYGDQHFRRSDNGNTMYNPFVENLIMDQFTTEIGGEVDFFREGVLAVFAMTGGEIKGNVTEQTAIDSVTLESNRVAPSIIAKLGYDKQMNEDLRVRISGSMYTTNSSINNTIYGGDRTGSRYYMVLENTKASTTTNAFSGRFNPGFSDQVTSFMVNPFVKYQGLEFFGTFEFSSGRSIKEKEKRDATQIAADLIYRFPGNENFWVGMRYNTLTSQLAFTTEDVTINRFAASAGWYPIKNLMAKVEYVNQTYKDFPASDIRNEGKFNGVMIEAAVGF